MKTTTKTNEPSKEFTLETSPFQAIVTSYHGPTDNRGARIKATSASGVSVTVGYDYGHKNPHEVAIATLLKKLNWGGRWVSGGWKNGQQIWVNVEGGQQ